MKYSARAVIAMRAAMRTGEGLAEALAGLRAAGLDIAALARAAGQWQTSRRLWPDNP